MTSTQAKAVETLAIGATYIALSAGLIMFNKYLLSADRFPHALQLTVVHMSVTTFYSLTLSSLVPSIYPSMSTSWEKKTTTMKYIAPLSIMFAFSLWASNQAYKYCSVAFLQFLKESNVAIQFFMSCIAGMQIFSWQKAGILIVIMAGCSLCAKGEIHFVLIGFILQMTALVSECAKNLIGEIVMSGAGLKLDPLTFVAWQAPCSLVPLLLAAAFTTEAQVLLDFKAHAGMILANASVAFLLNVVIAVTLKRLSALAFVIIGITKDVLLVYGSSYIFGDPISEMQHIGFSVTVAGVATWARFKMQEHAATSETSSEKQPLLPKNEKLKSETA